LGFEDEKGSNMLRIIELKLGGPGKWILRMTNRIDFKVL